MARINLVLLGSCLVWPVLALAQADDALSDLGGPAKVDEFNPDVTRKDGSESRPVRGGMLRVRTPGDPKTLNPICDSESMTRQVHQYLRDDLAVRDRETFEWLPALARWWEVRDTVQLTSGEQLEGRIIATGEDEIEFAPGVSRFTFAEHDLLQFELAPRGSGEQVQRFALGEGKPLPGATGTLVPRKETGIPAGIRGTLRRPPGGRYTVWLEQQPAGTRTIPRKEIAYVLEGEEGAQESLPALRREVVFLFHLRAGVRWHDGEPLTAADVVFSFDTIMNPAVDSAELRQRFEDLAEWEQADELTVRFRYRRQYFNAFSSLAESGYIYPRHRFKPEQFGDDKEGFGKYFNEHLDHQGMQGGPISTGPYRFARWERGKMLEIVRNDDWWANEKGSDGTRRALVPWIHPARPFLDKIRWVVINNKNAALKALTKGEVDADFDVEPITWEEADTNSASFLSSFVRARFLAPLYTYVGWNQRRKGVGKERQFFADHRVRRAMTLLIPRRKILAEIHYGLGEIVSGPFFKFGPYADRTVEARHANLRRAQLLLDEAGWIDHDGDGIRDKDGVAFEFEYMIHNMRDYHQKIADIMKESVERAGVRMSIRKLDWGVFLDTVSDQAFDAVRLAWGEPSCISTDPFGIWHSSQAAGRGDNYVHFASKEADRIIMRGRREMDLVERQRLYRRLHRLLDREQPYTFLFNFHSLYFYARKLRNVRFTVIGEDPFRWDEWYIPVELQQKK